MRPTNSSEAASTKTWLLISTAAFLVICIGVFSIWRGTRSTLARTPHRAQLEGQIKKAKQTVANYKGSHVVVGRVVLDGPGDPRDITAQMEILADGYFAGETKDLARPIGFRMHGYAPLDVQLKGKHGDVVDLGTIHMTPLAASKLNALNGQLTLEGSGDTTKADVSFTVMHGPINTPHGGTSDRSYFPKPIVARIDPAGQISATGFSPIQYYCIIRSPGYVTQKRPVSFVQGQTLDLGTINLEKAKQIEMTYIVAEKPPFDLAQKQTTTVHGGDRWKAEMKIYGWDLEFLQKEGELTFHASYYPCDITDLGPGVLDNFLNANPGKGKDPYGKKVESGHVYWFNAPTWKHSVLFRVDVR